MQPFKRKIINDPLYGFITITDPLVFEIIEHPYFQRLRRISQLGMASIVYPGALHTRFQHALGAMHLMTSAIESLRAKGFSISHEESLSATLAILLHDLGHGPCSHALEQHIVHAVTHEQITLVFMQQLENEFGGMIKLASDIFTDNFPRQFFHQLVSGQLDMDRLDYLMRDSFYTGVNEGIISTDRILKMLTIIDDDLAVELKGIYSVEKFIVARRLMYWQVYFHKTVLAAEYMLINILKRARQLIAGGRNLQCPGTLLFFLCQKVDLKYFTDSDEALNMFAKLDDYDLFSAIKLWMNDKDLVLSYLCKSLINRELFRVQINLEPAGDDRIEMIRIKIRRKFNLSEQEIDCLVASGEISNSAYDPTHDKITIVDKEGQRGDISGLSEQLNIAVYNQIVSKFFLFYPKWVEA